MGFNKTYLPELEELKKALESNPGLLEIYRKRDALVGPSDSINYLISLFEKSQKPKR